MTNSSGRISLKWNDFRHNTSSFLKELRIGTNFSDVTLVFDCNQQFKAHKIILTGCSPFFSTILNTNTHSHPMIYMRGVVSKHLGAIVDFIYHGEANIYEEDLNDFLALGEEFQLKGLAGSKNESFDHNKEDFRSRNKYKPRRRKGLKGKGKTKVIGGREIKHREEKRVVENEDKMIIGQDVKEEDETSVVENCVVVPLHNGKFTVASDITQEDLEFKIMSMLERVYDGFSDWLCKVCGKKSQGVKTKYDMKRHIESHLQGKKYPCNLCGKTSRSCNTYEVHAVKK